jgi:hypothetical protein
MDAKKLIETAEYCEKNKYKNCNNCPCRGTGWPQVGYILTLRDHYEARIKAEQQRVIDGMKKRIIQDGFTTISTFILLDKLDSMKKE